MRKYDASRSAEPLYRFETVYSHVLDYTDPIIGLFEEARREVRLIQPPSYSFWVVKVMYLLGRDVTFEWSHNLWFAAPCRFHCHSLRQSLRIPTKTKTSWKRKQPSKGSSFQHR
jgi:hypothetical protein